ncbi:MAG: hypothetical protein ABII76_01115 [Pseudomonadota bacterium]
MQSDVRPVCQAGSKITRIPREMIEGPENLVRISRLKRWEITAWYQSKNAEYDGLSPRGFLKDKSWAERQRVGLEALIDHGVLKP